jgi:hypothetical protein
LRPAAQEPFQLAHLRGARQIAREAIDLKREMVASAISIVEQMRSQPAVAARTSPQVEQALERLRRDRLDAAATRLVADWLDAVAGSSRVSLADQEQLRHAAIGLRASHRQLEWALD